MADYGDGHTPLQRYNCHQGYDSRWLKDINNGGGCYNTRYRLVNECLTSRAQPHKALHASGHGSPHNGDKPCSSLGVNEHSGCHGRQQWCSQGGHIWFMRYQCHISGRRLLCYFTDNCSYTLGWRSAHGQYTSTNPRQRCGSDIGGHGSHNGVQPAVHMDCHGWPRWQRLLNGPPSERQHRVLGRYPGGQLNVHCHDSGRQQAGQYPAQRCPMVKLLGKVLTKSLGKVLTKEYTQFRYHIL